METYIAHPFKNLLVGRASISLSHGRTGDGQRPGQWGTKKFEGSMGQWGMVEHPPDLGLHGEGGRQRTFRGALTSPRGGLSTRPFS